MIKSLWFKLSVCFSVLTLVGVTIMSFFSSLFLFYGEFNEIVVPKTVYEAVASEQLLFAEALRNPASGRWLALARQGVSDRLLKMESSKFEGEGDIRYISDPRVYFLVFDAAGKQVFSEPEMLPAAVADIFNAQKGQILPRAERLEQGIWVTFPLVDDAGTFQGHIDLLFVAEFDFWKPVLRTLDDYVTYWHILLLLFTPIGLMCGIAAAWFVTGRLRRINEVTTVWREGNLSPRIAIGRSSEDVLTKHSRHLNAMADDLGSLFTLQQKIAVTEERNRLARELHDTVKQNLFALKLQLAVIKHKNQAIETAPHIEEAEKITREAQQDLMEILTQLHPATHADNSFYGRITTLAEDMQRRFKVETAWEKREAIEVPPEQEHALIRLAQEAMNNAVRHGKATKIVMNLSREENTVSWSIANNGDSLSADANTSGFGLVSMRERVADLPEGKFSIANAKQGGVVVTIQWSVKE